jgi:hypothetical protein
MALPADDEWLLKRFIAAFFRPPIYCETFGAGTFFGRYFPQLLHARVSG